MLVNFISKFFYYFFFFGGGEGSEETLFFSKSFFFSPPSLDMDISRFITLHYVSQMDVKLAIEFSLTCAHLFSRFTVPKSMRLNVKYIT